MIYFELRELPSTFHSWLINSFKEMTTYLNGVDLFPLCKWWLMVSWKRFAPGTGKRFTGMLKTRSTRGSSSLTYQRIRRSERSRKLENLSMICYSIEQWAQKWQDGKDGLPLLAGGCWVSPLDLTHTWNKILITLQKGLGYRGGLEYLQQKAALRSFTKRE